MFRTDLDYWEQVYMQEEVSELRSKLTEIESLLHSWEEESKINRKMSKIVNIDFEEGSKYRLKRCIEELKKVIEDDSSKV